MQIKHAFEVQNILENWLKCETHQIEHYVINNYGCWNLRKTHFVKHRKKNTKRLVLKNNLKLKIVYFKILNAKILANPLAYFISKKLKFISYFSSPFIALMKDAGIIHLSCTPVSRVGAIKEREKGQERQKHNKKYIY